MAVKIEKRSFGKTARGENVTLFEIGTPELTARVLDYGATVQALLVTDQDGKTVDVVLGHDTIEGYETHDGYLGACVEMCIRDRLPAERRQCTGCRGRRSCRSPACSRRR